MYGSDFDYYDLDRRGGQRVNPTMEDHETKLIDATMEQLSPEQVDMIDGNSWLNDWFQDFLDVQNGIS